MITRDSLRSVLAGPGDDQDEQSKREIEAEAVTYLVGQYCGLDTSGSAFYLVVWQDDEPESIQSRLDRISSTAEEIIEVIDRSVSVVRRRTSLHVAVSFYCAAEGWRRA